MTRWLVTVDCIPKTTWYFHNTVFPIIVVSKVEFGISGRNGPDCLGQKPLPYLMKMNHQYLPSAMYISSAVAAELVFIVL